MSKDTGGSAFPVLAWDGPNEQMIWPETGMTLRDWFAGQALISVTSRSYTGNDAEYYAAKAYEIADAMIEARK